MGASLAHPPDTATGGIPGPLLSVERAYRSHLHITGDWPPSTLIAVPVM